MKKIIFDLYGVIIKESKGRFIPYVYEHLPKEKQMKVDEWIHKEQLFTKAQLGQITSDEFLSLLGFDKPGEHMKRYIEKYLTLDEGFLSFVEANKNNYEFALLSNDVLEWNQHLLEYYSLKKYFKEVMVSGAVGIRKPDHKIFQEAIKRLEALPEECIFIDNQVKNLEAAGKAGMNTILFNRDGVEYSGETVNDFVELNKIINDIF